MFKFYIYKNSVETSYRELEFEDEKSIHRDLYTLLIDEYNCSDEQAVEFSSWAELAVSGEECGTNEFTLVVMEVWN